MKILFLLLGLVLNSNQADDRDCFSDSYMIQLKEYYEECEESEGDDEWKVTICTFKKCEVVQDQDTNKIDFEKYKNQTLQEIVINRKKESVSDNMDECYRNCPDLAAEFVNCVRVAIGKICYS